MPTQTDAEMITVTIAHKCGHTFTYTFPGPRRIFHRSDYHMGNMICEGCRKKNPMPKAVVTPVGDCVEIAVVRGTYEPREILKTRGYMFTKDHPREQQKAWVLTCPRDQSETEIEWMESRGWEIEFREA